VQMLMCAASLELSPCLRGTHLAEHLSEELQKPFQAMSFDAMGRHMVRLSSCRTILLIPTLHAPNAAKTFNLPTLYLFTLSRGLAWDLTVLFQASTVDIEILGSVVFPCSGR
jgi:hypothetical protein